MVAIAKVAGPEERIHRIGGSTGKGFSQGDLFLGTMALTAPCTIAGSSMSNQPSRRVSPRFRVHRAQLLGRDCEQFVSRADSHKMTSSLDGMPYRSRHSASHRLVDGSRDKPIIRSLPYVDWPLDFRHVEGPAPIEELTVANQP